MWYFVCDNSQCDIFWVIIHNVILPDISSRIAHGEKKPPKKCKQFYEKFHRILKETRWTILHSFITITFLSDNVWWISLVWVKVGNCYVNQIQSDHYFNPCMTLTRGIGFLEEVFSLRLSCIAFIGFSIWYLW